MENPKKGKARATYPRPKNTELWCWDCDVSSETEICWFCGRSLTQTMPKPWRSHSVYDHVPNTKYSDGKQK